MLSGHALTNSCQFVFVLTSRDCATARQCQVLGVLPGDSLHWRMEPERLSNAHGGEGKAGQVIPLETYVHSMPAFSFFFFFCSYKQQPRAVGYDLADGLL